MTFSAPALYISIAAKVAYFAPWFPFWELCPQNSFLWFRKFSFFIVRSLFAARPRPLGAVCVLFVCGFLGAGSFLHWENDRRKFTCFYSSECCSFLLLDFCPFCPFCPCIIIKHKKCCSFLLFTRFPLFPLIIGIYQRFAPFFIE